MVKLVDEVIDQAAYTSDMPATRLIAEWLASATNTPVEEVAEIYAQEGAEPKRTALVKSFIE